MIDSILEVFPDAEILKADGFDSAVIGIDENSMRLIYSYCKCIDILMKEMDEIDAIEFMEFNVLNAYVGEKTPIWCMDNFLD